VPTRPAVAPFFDGDRLAAQQFRDALRVFARLGVDGGDVGGAEDVHRATLLDSERMFA